MYKAIIESRLKEVITQSERSALESILSRMTINK